MVFIWVLAQYNNRLPMSRIYSIGGEHDFMIRVMVPDMAAYRLFFVDKLGEVPNIAKLQSIIVLDMIKRGGEDSDQDDLIGQTNILRDCYMLAQ
jgi:DNA-binding Lrp family transcriptional regulator